MGPYGPRVVLRSGVRYAQLREFTAPSPFWINILLECYTGFVFQDLSHLRHDHLVVWDMLNQELKKVLEYIEPVNGNADVYSFRICDLILRTCMEFETVCRDALSVVLQDPTPRHEMKIRDYLKLRDHYHLARYDVGVSFWRPQKIYVDPFGSWWGPKPSLAWWNRHHAIKHDRHTNFQQATLNLLVESMAGLFALMTHTELLSTDQDHKESIHFPDGSFEDIHWKELFSLRGTQFSLQRYKPTP